MPLVLKWQGYVELCVNCILEIHGILNMLMFSIYQDFECIRNLNMLKVHRVY